MSVCFLSIGHDRHDVLSLWYRYGILYTMYGKRVSPSHFICLPSKRDNSVYFWTWGSYLLNINNATIVEENKQKTTLFTPMRGDSLSTILFILTTGSGITGGSSSIAAMTVHFIVKFSFSHLSVC